MKFIVYAIFKNEETHIKEFIENVSKYADIVVLGDTGSTDNTVSIINSLCNSKVELYDISSDIGSMFRFDKARQLLLNRIVDKYGDATCLSLDVDERMVGDINKWRNPAKSSKIRQYAYKFVWTHPSVTDNKVVFLQNRMHKSIGSKWFRATHEEIVVDGLNRSSVHTYDEDCYIQHYQLPKESRSGLDYPLLKLSLEENTDDEIGYYYLIRQCRIERKWDEMIKIYNKVCECNYKLTPKYKSDICMYVGDYFMEHKNYSNAEKMYSIMLEDHVKYMKLMACSLGVGLEYTAQMYKNMADKLK